MDEFQERKGEKEDRGGYPLRVGGKEWRKTYTYIITIIPLEVMIIRWMAARSDKHVPSIVVALVIDKID